MNNNYFLYKKLKISLPVWTLLCPLLAIIILWVLTPVISGGAITFLKAAALIGVVLSAVHHAEVIAHRVGEPMGTLILALAITIIEVSLIVSIMLSEGEGAATLARDTVFAAIMIILTGIIGLCLLWGGYRYIEQQYTRKGVNTALIALTAISILTLVLPNYTTSEPGPYYNNSQLIFAAIISLIIYAGFVAVQTGRHSDYFLPDTSGQEIKETANEHPERPSLLTTFISLGLLFVALWAVVVLSKKLSPDIESAVSSLGAPKSLVGIIIAAVILLPEGLAAIRAARKNQLQTSLNLALGSALASIGLTIPAVAIVAYFTGMTVTLGIDTKSTLLLVLSLFIISISFNAGKTNIMQGIIMLVIFATYLFTTIVP